MIPLLGQIFRDSADLRKMFLIGVTKVASLTNEARYIDKAKPTVSSTRIEWYKTDREEMYE